MTEKCPKCDSPQPHLHPSMQPEGGEVQPCSDPFHKWDTPQNRPYLSSDSKLKPCPFCGDRPAIEPWHGGGHDKRMVSCMSDACYVNPAVTGENEQEAANHWNARPAP